MTLYAAVANINVRLFFFFFVILFQLHNLND